MRKQIKTSYLHVNSLHGWVISQYLPTGEFKWVTDKVIKSSDTCKVAK